MVACKIIEDILFDIIITRKIFYDNEELEELAKYGTIRKIELGYTIKMSLPKIKELIRKLDNNKSYNGVYY